MDPRVLGYHLGLSCLTGIVFGTLPALSSRADLVSAVQQAAGARASAPPGAGCSRAHRRERQVAVSVVLLVGAGLLLASVLPAAARRARVPRRASAVGRNFRELLEVPDAPSCGASTWPCSRGSSRARASWQRPSQTATSCRARGLGHSLVAWRAGGTRGVHASVGPGPEGLTRIRPTGPRSLAAATVPAMVPPRPDGRLPSLGKAPAGALGSLLTLAAWRAMSSGRTTPGLLGRRVAGEHLTKAEQEDRRPDRDDRQQDQCGQHAPGDPGPLPQDRQLGLRRQLRFGRLGATKATGPRDPTALFDSALGVRGRPRLRRDRGGRHRDRPVDLRPKIIRGPRVSTSTSPLRPASSSNRSGITLGLTTRSGSAAARLTVSRTLPELVTVSTNRPVRWARATSGRTASRKSGRVGTTRSRSTYSAGTPSCREYTSTVSGCRPAGYADGSSRLSVSRPTDSGNSANTGGWVVTCPPSARSPGP